MATSRACPCFGRSSSAAAAIPLSSDSGFWGAARRQMVTPCGIFDSDIGLGCWQRKAAEDGRSSRLTT